jgi:glucokinase
MTPGEARSAQPNVGAKRALTLGVDVGGTKIRTALVDADGTVVASHRHPTDATEGPEGLMADIRACVGGCLGVEATQATSVGMGIAGQVDVGTGVLRFAPNLGWRDVPLKALLQDALDRPATVMNDVQAATWGEWRHGAGKGVHDIVCVFVGTGVGGGIVSGGQLVTGCSGAGGELGHVTLVEGGRDCRCRNRGCLEAYVGGWAIGERAQEAAADDPSGAESIIARAGGLVRAITAAHVSDAYHEGDSLASRLVTETARFMAAGLVGVVNTLNPCLLILGGGVIEGTPELIDLAEPQLRKRALAAAVEQLRVTRARLGGDAPVVGAASFARTVLLEAG